MRRGKKTGIRGVAGETEDDEGKRIEGRVARSAHGHRGPERIMRGNAGAGRRRNTGTGAEGRQEAIEGSGGSSPKGTRYGSRSRTALARVGSLLRHSFPVLSIRERKNQKKIIFEIVNPFFAGDLVKTLACWGQGREM